VGDRGFEVGREIFRAGLGVNESDAAFAPFSKPLMRGYRGWQAAC